MNKTIQLSKEEILRKEILDNLAKNQDFRVAVGKSTWIQYREFKPEYNLREILNNEIVIEFDCEDSLIGWLAVNDTCINLFRAGYEFEVWEHGGRSPHIHIRELPISHLEKNKRSLFKKLFLKKYVPSEFLKYVDYSLCGIHLVRIEWSPCWKGKYGIKELVNKFNPKEDLQ